MKAFIGAVIVAGFFGPYLISLLLGALCLATWIAYRNVDAAAAERDIRHDTRPVTMNGP